FIISYFYPNRKPFKEEDHDYVEMKEWKYTRPMAIILCIITVVIYVLLGTN
ncbi:unnamed protein product, partial [Ectocarpus sp. 12 AP-2014]